MRPVFTRIKFYDYQNTKQAKTNNSIEIIEKTKSKPLKAYNIHWKNFKLNKTLFNANINWNYCGNVKRQQKDRQIF